MECFELK